MWNAELPKGAKVPGTKNIIRYVSERRLRQVDLGGVTRPRNPNLVSKVKYNPKRASREISSNGKQKKQLVTPLGFGFCNVR